MSAFYTFLSSLYNCLLKFIWLIIVLGEVRKILEEALKISGEMQSHPWRGAHLPTPSPQNKPSPCNSNTVVKHLLMCQL